MRLILTVAVAALVLAFAGSTADAKKAKAAKGETFNISCPALAPVPMKMGTCTGTRASCQTKYQMCYVGTQPKKAKKAKGKKKSKK